MSAIDSGCTVEQKPDTPPAETITGDREMARASCHETLAYIAELVAELRTLSDAVGTQRLSTILALAQSEAQRERSGI